MRRIPAVVSAVLLAAHFFRNGSAAGTVVCLALPLLFFSRRPAAVIASRILLCAGAFLWAMTAVSIARARVEAGEPWIRMAAILAAVALFTALSAWILPRGRRMVR